VIVTSNIGSLINNAGIDLTAEAISIYIGSVN
jgi:hypothetical protein